jgi:uncharacterized integral membrane protein (TIGR00698 family)
MKLSIWAASLMPFDLAAPGADGTGWVARHRVGLTIAATIALAASFMAEHYGAPAMLFALLIGMAFNFLATDKRAAEGIEVASKVLLRIGVALLGLRLTFASVAELGIAPIVGVATLLVCTLGVGVLAARLIGRPLAFGLLSGGAVAICGASAALAIAAVIPKKHLTEQDVLFTVVGVTALSTVAMIVYPMIFGALGLDDLQSGYLIGATIHDVAQVVGAGYSISDRAGDIATFTKLVRVALLPVVLLIIAVVYRNDSGGKVGLPWFVVVFIALMLLRNMVTLPGSLLSLSDNVSRFLLLTAISALGVKTSLLQLMAAGPRNFGAVAGITVALLAMALFAVECGLV